ncbi:putative non-hem dioxygenase domain, isopenicillin N synthase [Lupinus albus]|uniref:Putative non-hem dioxygenase domain, isopenicillin N synthase n=1 Tax=Lupinus albus TaxID=3870 RepID=A0A6A4NWK9_LUPAL|nr:putative non-hem dioxygenase domain, isopenicillin N synthase [Lupinus albus]
MSVSYDFDLEKERENESKVGVLNISCKRCRSRRIVCKTMSSFPTFSTVSIPFSLIQDRNADLSFQIEQGFGRNGLGIVSVTHVPGYSSLRTNLLHLAPRLASLPKEVKEGLEDPHSRYNFGWSHGKENLESGKPDLLKGSFYANPMLDTPTTNASLIQRYPSYCGTNIWPSSALPELEVAFKALGKLIFDVGLMLAYHCDQYVSRGMKIHKDEGLESILQRSRCHKGRLLYYFPSQQGNADGNSKSSWCGWHTDHGSLTGLACAIFTRDGVEIPCPDIAAGLYIRTRSDQIVKVVYGKDDIAFQIGETTEILSGGYLCATPHCVQAPKGEESSGIERSTFALFMQPDWDEKLNFPEEVNIHRELIPSNAALTFGEYSEMLLDKYYHQKQT